jgi:hypothetical protein
VQAVEALVGDLGVCARERAARLLAVLQVFLRTSKVLLRALQAAATVGAMSGGDDLLTRRECHPRRDAEAHHGVARRQQRDLLFDQERGRSASDRRLHDSAYCVNRQREQ